MLVDRLRGAWHALTGTKESAAGSLVALGESGRAAWTPRRYDELAREAYQKNVVAYSAISQVTEGFASVPWRLFRRGKDKRTEIDTHPLLDLLSNPSPTMTGSNLMEAFSAFYLIAGNSYIEAVGPDGKPPRELWPLRPDRMKLVPGKLGIVQQYEYHMKGMKHIWEVNPLDGRSAILHWKTFNPLNDWYGQSAIEAAAFSIDQHNSAGEWNQSLLQNRGAPSGALVFSPKDKSGRPATLTDQQRTKLHQDLESKFSGARNAGRPLLLEGDFDWKAMGLTARDMDWLKGRDVSARDTALAFGVPSQLVGIPDAATYSNMQEARLGLWEETIIPLLGDGRDALNWWLVPMFEDDLELDYDLDQVSALNARRQKKFEMVEGVDFMTINEKREAVGLEPTDGGEVLLVPATMLPLAFAAAPPTIPGTDKEEGMDIEYKLLTDRSPGARQRELLVQHRMQGAFERVLFASMVTEFNRAAQDSADGFRIGGEAEANHRLSDHHDRTMRIIKGHHSAVMEVFGRRILDAGKFVMGPREVKDEDQFNEAAQAWIAANSANQVTAITDTTREQVRAAIAAGEEAALGVMDIARDIVASTGAGIGRRRAEVIARTETHSAAVAAGDEAAAATGLRLKREWIAAEDSRTRPSHSEADGQRRDFKEPFRVGGTDLMRPGDPAGPARETVNCRCVVGHLTEDEVA